MRQSFQYQNCSIVYRTEGAGVNVLFLHGFGEDSHIWDNQIDFLKDHCRVIAPDLPGSGLSTTDGWKLEVAHEESNYHLPSTIEYYADCIYALLKHENIASCIMLGHSMGGYITLAFAEKYPTLLKSFGLVHSTAFADSEEKKVMRKKAIDAINEYGGYSFLKNTIPNLFGRSFKQKYPEKINGLVEEGRQFSKVALQQYYLAMMSRPNRKLVLQNSKVPVLFVMGTEDIAAPIEAVLKQVHLPEMAYIYILKNCGHMGMLEEKGLMNKYLLEFIMATEQNRMK